MLKYLTRRKSPEESAPVASVGEGRRVYAIGDIHGRLDLLDALLERIHADSVVRGEAESHLIFLGDLIDRGPDSAGVVRRARTLAAGGRAIRFLKGNHEEVFLDAARGDLQTLRFFTRIGGRETLLSYGLSADDFDRFDIEELGDWMLNHVPRADVDFLEDFEDMIEIGDYIFVHAGIRPKVPLTEQNPTDLRWIREEFLSWRQPYGGKIIVHGHTITQDVDEHSNRIGIDTGAFHSGRLTAIGLEGMERWYLSTAD
ncbi:MAG: serine/threonine protein phosphatase [Alphaproteobacteria bacterium]|nr:serine/threonine protein phosphatase [Alphaproteobacteria bacterium]